MEPCVDCAKAIISAGIKRVVCQMRYKDSEIARDFFKQAGIEVVALNDAVAKY
jgi:dCMP deaminase